MEYLSKIQNDQKELGKQLKEIRIKSGLELKDMPYRDLIEIVERGQLDRVTAKYLIQHAHAIGAQLTAIDANEVNSPVTTLLNGLGDICDPNK